METLRPRPRRAHRAPRRPLKETLVPILAMASVAGFVAVPLAGPSGMSASAAWYEAGPAEVRSVVTSGTGQQLGREDFSVSTRYSWAQAPAVGRPDPGTAQAVAYGMVAERGWDESQYSCLVALWSKESGWNHFAMNRSSGAYGIPQALPGEKMASAGPDWATNPETQIRWGLGYIEGRYGNPCAAWGHSQRRNWY